MAEIIIALDVASGEAALKLMDRLPGATFFKVGLELFTREGPAVVSEIRSRGARVFLDLKLHDIPNTVAAATEAAADLGVDLLTVHASGGSEMIAAARRAVGASETRLVGVTALTSMSRAELGEVWRRPDVSPPELVAHLAGLAMRGGAHGVVCSPLEARALREQLGTEAVLVTPGIRLGGEPMDDQARVATPGEACLAGANYLVVGRSVTRADDPLEALGRVRADLAAA